MIEVYINSWLSTSGRFSAVAPVGLLDATKRLVDDGEAEGAIQC